MKANGTIQGYQVKNPEKRSKETGGRVVAKHWEKRSKEKDFIGWNLLYWANKNMVTLEEEFKFHPERKWRFDWAIESMKLAIEYNGIMSDKSRHTTVSGYTGDMNKINSAQAMGWRIIQLTPLNYKELFTELNKYL